jgi:transposase-like protein
MLTDKQRDAARLIASNKLTIAQIAETVGISSRTVNDWKRLPEMESEVRKFRRAWRDHAKQEGIGDPDRRLAQINKRWRKLQAVIAARAKCDRLQHVPGGTTGLITVTERSIRLDNDNYSVVEEAQIDTGLLAEMRALEVAAAIELGQYKQVRKIEGEVHIQASPEAVTLARLLSREQLEEMRDRLKAMTAEGPGDPSQEPGP